MLIAQAEWIIDIGFGVGKYGGNIIFEGTDEKLPKRQKSYTSLYVKKT
jgi:excinuclease UvrABC ATPase subunit